MKPEQPDSPSRRRRIYAGVAVGCILSVVLGADLVRVALNALDAKPYAGAATEDAYLVVAIVALLIWWGGTAACIVIGRVRLRSLTTIGTQRSAPKADSRPPS